MRLAMGAGVGVLLAAGLAIGLLLTLGDDGPNVAAAESTPLAAGAPQATQAVFPSTALAPTTARDTLERAPATVNDGGAIDAAIVSNPADNVGARRVVPLAQRPRALTGNAHATPTATPDADGDDTEAPAPHAPLKTNPFL